MRARAGGVTAAPTDAPPAGDRVLTVPNAISAVRLAGVPLFLWLVLGPHADGAALAVLVVAGLSDWLDGRLARSLGQVSRVGQILDPLADRLYILATLVGLTARDICPLWLAVAIVARDVLLLGTLPVLRRLGYGPLPVHFLGKAATLGLLYAFPLLLLAHGDSVLATVARPVAWAFTLWGLALYWYAGWLYVVQTRQLAREVSLERQAAAWPRGPGRPDMVRPS